jgi:thiamine-phosphate pyrophosphorylase
VTLPDPPILVITNRKACREPLELRAGALFRAGCRWLSLRENDLEPPARLALLDRLIDVGQAFGASVGVHRDIEAAKATGSALHLPAGTSSALARRELGDTVLLGQSCHDASELANAVGVDYVTISPVFVSAGKPEYGPCLGTKGLRSLTTMARIPVIALGGIRVASLPELEKAGVDGIAVMGDAMSVRDPLSWFVELREALVRPRDQV